MLPRYAHNIYHVHIADGFASDCDELIHKCLQFQTLHFQTFCEIWKNLQFGMIYHGRSSGAEIAELSEEVIHIAKQYMVKDSSNFEESVAGLFLVYGLVTLQPFCGFARLRIVPDDVPAINRIQMVARRERRLDVLYILGEVLIKHSQYHAAERDHGMESGLRKYLEGYTSIDKLGVRPRGVFYRQNEELDIIRDLGTVTRQYTRAKNSLISQPDYNLKYIDENLSNELNTTLRQVINGLIENDDGSDDDNDKDEDRRDTVQTIKAKAMSHNVKPIKHLTGLDERKSEKATSPKNKSDFKPTNSKIKTNNPIKPITNSPRKQKTDATKKCDKNESDNADTSSADLILDDFDKIIDENTTDSKKIKQDLDIKVDAQPVTIETEQGQAIEIEFVDNSVNFVTNDEVISCNRVSAQKRKRTETTTIVQNKEKPPHKPRTRIKSKFRKMGMLPVANFNDQK